MIWSLSRNKWLKGPVIPEMPMPIRFAHTCAIAINKTAVLFIGLYDDDILAKFDYNIPMTQVPNDIVIIYNFEFNSWALQDFLPINGSVPKKSTISSYVHIDTSCGVIHEKVRSRLVLQKSYVIRRKYFK